MKSASRALPSLFTFCATWVYTFFLFGAAAAAAASHGVQREIHGERHALVRHFGAPIGIQEAEDGLLRKRGRRLHVKYARSADGARRVVHAQLHVARIDALGVDPAKCVRTGSRLQQVAARANRGALNQENKRASGKRNRQAGVPNW